VALPQGYRRRRNSRLSSNAPHASPMSLIFATQLTAVAIAALALFAIVIVVYAVRAFRNVIEITENADLCLLYDQPLTGAGAVVARADGLVDVEARPDRSRARQGTQPIPPPRRENGQQRVRASCVHDVRRALRHG
jgi:hypothetical protein